MNVALNRLLTGALRDARLNIDELAAASGLNRGVVGRLVRGDVQYCTPEYADALVPHLPITMEDIVEANGFRLTRRTRRQVPAALDEAWPLLPKRVQEAILLIAEQAASPGSGGGAQ